MRRPARGVRIAAVTLALAAEATLPAAARREPPTHGVRSTDALISDLVAEGYAQSAAFRRLVETIAESDGIVYVVPGECPMRGMRGCLLHTLHNASSARYLWILIESAGPPAEVIATLAHELQHAVEVLQAPSVRSGRGMRRFYSSRESGSGGFQRGGNSRAYETAAAIRIAATVRSELAAARERAADDDVR